MGVKKKSVGAKKKCGSKKEKCGSEKGKCGSKKRSVRAIKRSVGVKALSYAYDFLFLLTILRMQRLVNFESRNMRIY